MFSCIMVHALIILLLLKWQYFGFRDAYLCLNIVRQRQVPLRPPVQRLHVAAVLLQYLPSQTVVDCRISLYIRRRMEIGKALGSRARVGGITLGWERAHGHRRITA